MTLLLLALWAVLPQRCMLTIPPPPGCAPRELPGPTKCWEMLYDETASTPQPVMAVPMICVEPQPQPWGEWWQ